MDKVQGVAGTNSISDAQRMLLIFGVTLAAARLLQEWNKRRHLPPGPSGWPVLGNLPMMGSAPHLYFYRLWKEYGPVVRIKMGSRDTVIINGYSACRQALVTQGADFAGRPDFDSFNYISEGTSFAFTTYNERWKLHRKIAASAMRQFTHDRENPVDQMLARQANGLVKQLLSWKGKPCDPVDPIRDVVANAIFTLCFGKEVDYHLEPDYQVLYRNVQRFTEIQSAGGNIADVMPWTKWIPYTPKRMKDFLATAKNMRKVCNRQSEEHQKTYDPNKTRDIFDALITATGEVTQQQKDAVGLTDWAILMTIQSMIGPGMTTVATALHWMVMYLARYQHVQDRAHAEINDVIESEKDITYADRNRLPYVNAVMHECLRHTAFVPNSLPHATVTDTTLNGFHIPKGTLIFPNFWSVSRDKTIWREPEKFDPERMLKSDGTELDKEKAERMPAFGWGKRRCIGEYLGRAETFILFATLIRSCRFEEDPEHPLDFEPIFRLSLDPKPYKVLITARE